MSASAGRPFGAIDPPVIGHDVGRPAHSQIEHWLVGLIDRGELLPGDRLPREDDLAAMLGVSRMTLRQALGRLESHGTITRRTGRSGGTFVAEPRIECDLTGLAGFSEQARRADLRAGARIVSAASVRAPRVAGHALGLARGAAVYEIVRVRTVRRQPMALERTYLPAELFPDLLSHGLRGSLYRLMAGHYGQRPHTAVENLDAVPAEEQAAELLGVAVGSPVMRIERTVYTAAGLAVEYARDLFRPDRVRISLRTGM